MEFSASNLTSKLRSRVYAFKIKKLNQLIPKEMEMKRFVALGLTATLAFTYPANAVEVEQMGNCSASSRWSADMELEYKVFDLSFDVDTQVADQDWTFRLKQNGKKAFTQTLKSMKDFDDSYAEVEWDVIRPDRKGSDTFNFRAVNKVTGEVCKATLKA